MYHLGKFLRKIYLKANAFQQFYLYDFSQRKIF